jgi:8-oxo-dGTP diphosphatase
MPYTPILATLGYVLSEGGSQVLMLRRDRRLDDLHFGKYNGLGGKLEAGEDVAAGMKREVREEAGLECLSLRLRGTVSWPGFGKDGEDWFGFVFVIDRWQGAALTENAEGTLTWLPVARILDLPLWDGDRHFLPLVFDNAIGQFHGVMPYRHGRPVSWQYTILGKSEADQSGFASGAPGSLG